MNSSPQRQSSDERILGSSDFVEHELERANEDYEKKTLAVARGLDLDRLIEAVSNRFEIDRDTVISSTKQRIVARARAVIRCLAVDNLMISGADVARKLDTSPSAVSKLAARGRVNSITKGIADKLFVFK